MAAASKSIKINVTFYWFRDAIISLTFFFRALLIFCVLYCFLLQWECWMSPTQAQPFDWCKMLQKAQKCDAATNSILGLSLAYQINKKKENCWRYFLSIANGIVRWCTLDGCIFHFSVHTHFVDSLPFVVKIGYSF